MKTHYGKLKGKHTQTKGDEDMKIMMIESKTRKSAMKRAPWAAKKALNERGECRGFRGTLYVGKDMQELTGDFSLRLTLHDDFPDILEADGKLGEILDFPALFGRYPAIADVETRIFAWTEEDHVYGWLQARRGFEEIVIHAKTPTQAASFLLHEIQHFIQRTEKTLPQISWAGFVGTAAEYNRTPAERQARKAQESVVLVEES